MTIQLEDAGYVDEDIIAQGKKIEEAANKAVRQALRKHKLLGQSIAVSRDGEVVIVPPEEIPDYPEET